MRAQPSVLKLSRILIPSNYLPRLPRVTELRCSHSHLKFQHTPSSRRSVCCAAKVRLAHEGREQPQQLGHSISTQPNSLPESIISSSASNSGFFGNPTFCVPYSCEDELPFDRSSSIKRGIFFGSSSCTSDIQQFILERTRYNDFFGFRPNDGIQRASRSRERDPWLYFA